MDNAPKGFFGFYFGVRRFVRRFCFSSRSQKQHVWRKRRTAN